MFRSRSYLLFVSVLFLNSNLIVRNDLHAQDANELLIELMTKADEFREFGFLLKVTSVSADSGGQDPEKLFGLIDHRVTYGQSKQDGEFWREWGTYVHERRTVNESGDLSSLVPSVRSVRTIVDSDKKRRFFIRTCSDWEGKLVAPINKWNDEQRNDYLKSIPGGNYGLIGLTQPMYLTGTLRTPEAIVNLYSKLEPLADSKSSSGKELVSDWKVKGVEDFCRITFSAEYNWLPSSIQFTTKVGANVKPLSQSRISWKQHKPSGRWLQDKAECKCYTVDGMEEVYDLQFDWRLEDEFPDGTFKRMMIQGFDRATSSFPDELSWPAIFHEYFEANPTKK